MPEWMLRVFWSVACCIPKEIVNETKKKVPLEQKYILYGIPVKAYVPRGRLLHRKAKKMRTGDIEEEIMVSPEQVPTMSSTGNNRALKRTYAVAGQQQYPKHQENTDHHPLDLADSFVTIPRATKWTKFSKLDQMRNPGLSEEDFRGLFVQCENCQRITTRDVFRYHLEGCEGYQHGDTDTSESEQEI